MTLAFIPAEQIAETVAFDKVCQADDLINALDVESAEVIDARWKIADAWSALADRNYLAAEELADQLIDKYGT